MLPLHPWVRKCLDYLEKLPQICAIATTEPYIEGEILTDGKLTLTTQNEGKEINYLFVIKPEITPEFLEKQLEYLYHLRQRLDSSQRLLLISKDLSDYVVDTLLEKNIEFLDANGTIYLNNPAFYILIRNLDQQASNYNKEPIHLTADDLKVMFVILKDSRILNNLPLLSKLSSVNLSDIQTTLSILNSLGYIRNVNTNKYTLSSFEQLLNRWELGYNEILRPSLFIDSFRFLDSSLFSKNLDKLIHYSSFNNLLIGGEVGAALITNYLKPITAVLHIPNNQNYRKIMVDLRLVPDPNGNITFLRRFSSQNQWNNDDKYPIADPLLIHAELMINPDSRLKEVATIIYDKIISPLEYQNQIYSIVEEQLWK